MKLDNSITGDMFEIARNEFFGTGRKTQTLNVPSADPLKPRSEPSASKMSPATSSDEHV
jgi:hypothetical protein